MTKRNLSILLALLAALAAGSAFYFRSTGQAPLPCPQQPAAQYTPACLARAKDDAARGKVGAMAALAEYFATRQPAESQRWTRAAAGLGDQRSISLVLAACGAGKPYTEQEAQALLARATTLEVLNFQLGGSCGAADMAAARRLKPAELMAADDAAGLCKVAIRYGLLRLTKEGAALDSSAAQALLAECERRPQTAAPLRSQATGLRQLLAREVKPLHLE